MKTSSKILATIGIIIGYIFILGLIGLSSKANGTNPSGGIFGLLLLIGLIAALRSVWKSKPPSNV